MKILNYPVTRKTLSEVYRLRPQTFRERLRDIGIEHNSTLSPKDLRKIVETYQLPEGVQINI